MISTSCGSSISLATTVPAPFLRSTRVTSSRLCSLNTTPLRFQQDVDDIFTNTGNGRIFVHHASHLHFGRRVAGHRRQQYAARGVAQRVAVAALERLHHDLGVMRPDRFDFDGTRLQKTFEWTCTVFPFNTLGSLHR